MYSIHVRNAFQRCMKIVSRNRGTGMRLVGGKNKTVNCITKNTETLVLNEKH